MSHIRLTLRITGVHLHDRDLESRPLSRAAVRRLAAWTTVVAAQALFLWMFFAAAPLEQLAASGAIGASDAIRGDAFSFAAAWRHGMASNSPLYMPGFFAVAWASWTFATFARRRDVSLFAFGLAMGVGLALAFAPAGADRVIASYSAHSGIRFSGSVPLPSGVAIFSGVYTLLTWTAFVIGSRATLARRSLRPLLPVPFLTVVLVLVRPWTVDDFTSIWWQRVRDGQLVAIASVLLIPLVAWLLASRVGRPPATASRSCAVRL
jgi:hypothetical protein